MEAKVEAKRGRGRPRTRPENPVKLRCDLSPAEAAEVEAARLRTGESQGDFCRRVVVAAARAANRPDQ